ncbi:MAG: glycoside hydrolase family 65 protein [Phycisphaerales bacterium]|nr:glycoside hydrolase family 65 protein [Phycisphaerales bacterium]
MAGASDAWTVVETRFDPAMAKAYEGLFTLGSGYLHVRGSLEEHLPDQPQNVEYERRAGNVTSEEFRNVLAQWGTYVPGVFARHPTLNNQMVNLPWPLRLGLAVDGERLSATSSRLLEWRRELSLRAAVLRRKVLWETESGAMVTVNFERFVSAMRPGVIAQRMTVEAAREIEAEVTAGIDADVRTNGCWHFGEVSCGVAGEPPQDLRVCVVTDGGDKVEMRSRVRSAAPGNWEFNAEADSRRRSCGQRLWVRVAPGVPLSVEKVTTVSTSRDAGREGAGDAGRAGGGGYDELLVEHRRVWEERWARSDVEIEGDPESQLAARIAIFHLLRAHVPGDPRVAIDAKGYAGEAYWGRYFWDTEMYLLPFYLYSNPDAARTLAAFRVHTLEGAKRNAARYGYPGARYAWESDASGDECCPNWQYADHEVHVTADVAYGLAHYAAASGDSAFLQGPAAEVLVETARYWMERITFEDRVRRTRPRLLGVMGPDEYKPITNDNAYTNGLVAESLRLAAEHGQAVVGVTASERAAWRRTADGLSVLRGSDGVLVMQCEGFDGFADPEFDRLWIDRDRTFAAQVSQERLYRGKCLKQADVLMLMAIFPDKFTDEEVRRAWDYYLPYTTHDSSLSAGAHCLVACRLGLDDQAWAFWRRGSRQDLPEADGGEGGAAEGIHIAGAGAVWMMIGLGFGGLRTALQSEELTLTPRLPKAWTGVRFPLVWKGQALRVEIAHGRTVISNRSERELVVSVRGVRRAIAPAKEEVFA